MNIIIPVLSCTIGAVVGAALYALGHKHGAKTVAPKIHHPRVEIHYEKTESQ